MKTRASYRDDISHASEFVAPTLTWRPTTRDTLTVLALYGHLYGDFDPGFTPVKQLLSLPVSRNLGLTNFDRGKRRQRHRDGGVRPHV